MRDDQKDLFDACFIKRRITLHLSTVIFQSYTTTGVLIMSNSISSTRENVVRHFSFDFLDKKKIFCEGSGLFIHERLII